MKMKLCKDGWGWGQNSVPVQLSSLTYSDQIRHGKTHARTSMFLRVIHTPYHKETGTSDPKTSWDPLHTHIWYEKQ